MKKLRYSTFYLWIVFLIFKSDLLPNNSNFTVSSRCVEVIAREGRNLKELYLVSCKITDYGM